MRFRPAVPADVPAVVALVESAYRGEASRAGWTTEADLLGGQRTDAAEVTASLPALLLAVEGEELVGSCRLDVQAAEAHVGMFAVRPAGQGGGTGSALLAEAERRAAGRGARQVELTVLVQRTALLAWYARRGYADTGERRPFPYGDRRFGVPKRDDLEFAVLVKEL